MNAGAAIEATSWSAVLVGGPLIAGVIVATLGPGWAIAFDAATFLVSAGCITATRPLVDRGRTEPGSSVVRDIREGWRELLARRWLLISFGLSAVRSLICMGPMFVLGPVLAAAHLGGARGRATVCVCWGLGGVVGSVAPLRLRPAYPLVGAFLGMALIGPALLVWLVAPDSLPLVAGAAFVGGLGFFYDEAVVTALIPDHVSDGFRSRVNAYAWIAWYVAQPLGMAAAGVVSTLLDPGLVLATAGLTVMAGGLVAIAVPAVNRLPRTSEAA